MTSRRLFLSTILAGLTVPALARAALSGAQQAAVDRVTDWMKGLKTLSATFVQIAPSGALTTGRLWIQRPGEMRMQYDPPANILLVTTDWRLVFYDGTTKQVNYIPVAQTPLGFLLARNPDFGDEVLIRDVEVTGGEIRITAFSKGNEDQGSVQLVFAEKPVELRRWTVFDPGGTKTVVTLSDVRTNQDIDQELFVWRDPQLFGYPDLD
ncbi:LolA family protein [Geminicoccus roseus]|uniref:LolA family protein n=1 Tax=Geminicoccus roseus TaxID=404900 RepID=UPI0004280EBD|nr:outer membrane lipoprotein carrier protein LolA [Geminicoccus roseus]